MRNIKPKQMRPLSPNVQIYRPQLTSVLSIANRITGVILSLCAVGLVAWLVAAAEGPHAYGTIQVVIQSWAGQIMLLSCTFSFYLHFCGGIRHLTWDAGGGFELGAIYASGWTVVAASMALTVITWITARALAG